MAGSLSRARLARVVPTHLILVPGFLGFQRLGSMSYFVKVEEVLKQLGERLLEDVHVQAIRTLPTGSLGARAAKLAEFVASLPDDGGDVHLLGHSTGGLDARLFLSPYSIRIELQHVLQKHGAIGPQ